MNESKAMLAACPFCGNRRIRIQSNGVGDFYAICHGDEESPHCGARTSDVRCETEDQAARRWNCRPALRSAPQGDGRALELWDARESLCSLGTWQKDAADLLYDEIIRLQHRLNALSAPPSVALEAGDLTDDQIMEILRRVTKDQLYEMLTCKRWKDGIDIDCPTFAAQWLAKEFRAALTRPQPGGAITDDDLKCFGQLEVKTP